jgi:hypothetical protein
MNAFFNLEKRVTSATEPSSMFPLSNGWMQAAGDPNVFVATYPDYLASAKSFSQVWGDTVRGIKDPKAFLSALKNKGFNSGSDFTNTGTINLTKARMQCP